MKSIGREETLNSDAVGQDALLSVSLKAWSPPDGTASSMARHVQTKPTCFSIAVIASGSTSAIRVSGW
jgi:hypothetical protein